MFMPKSNSGDFTPAPAGTHIAVCIKVVDLGTQVTEYQGQTKQQHKVMLAWELPNEVMADGKPFIHMQRYTFSSSDKATFRKHLEGWRGRKFSDADFGPGGFDIRNVLGKPCSLIVSHAAKGDKVYANVDGIGPLPKGVPVPQPSNGLLYFSLEPDEFKPEVFSQLSDGLKRTIMASPEYVKIANGHAPEASDDIDEEIPF